MDARLSAALAAIVLSACASRAHPIEQTHPAPRRAVEPAPTLSPQELLERNDELVGFTARYRLTTVDGVERLTLRYAAPHWASMTLEHEDLYVRIALVEGVMSVDRRDDSNCRKIDQFDFRQVARKLDEFRQLLTLEFPELWPPRDVQDAEAVCFAWDSRPPQESGRTAAGASDRPSMTFALGFMSGTGYHVCEWLESALRRGDPARVSPETWTWCLDGGAELDISRTTGFITEVRAPADSKGLRSVVLEELELVPPSADVFTTPDWNPDDTECVDLGIRDALLWTTLESCRSRIWSRCADGAEAGTWTWDEATPEKFRRIFRALYGLYLQENSTSYLASMRTWVDESALQVGAAARRLRTKDRNKLRALERSRDDALARLHQNLDGATQRILAIEPPTSEERGTPWADGLLRAERQAALLAHEEVVRAPILDYFHERFDAVLPRK